MSIGNFTALALFAWVAWGALWLYPKKRALLRRLGDLNNDELAKRAEGVDVEAMHLRTKTRWYLGVGLAVLLPLVTLATIFK